MLGRKERYVRCLNCSWNNIAKGTRPLDKKAIYVFYRKKIIQERAFESNIPLKSIEYNNYT